MKTLSSPLTIILHNVKTTDDFKLWAKLILIQCLTLVSIILAVSFVSRVHAQTVLQNEIAQVNPHTNMRLAAFASELPQAEKLPSIINSTFKEVGPLVSPDGKTLFFSRQNHPENTGGVMDYEDIWYSTYNQKTDDWGAPKRMEAPINNFGPNSINFMSITGDTIVLANKYLKNGKMAAGLSMSVKENEHWSFPQPCKNKCQFNVSDRFSMSLSYNKQILMTSQELDDSNGARDIYVSFIHPDHTCTTINVGSVINTELEESSPFLAPDYKTMYFASKGHNGFGGFDIFVSHRLDETWQNWSEPENLGPGVNSNNNEEFFNFTFDGQYAFFSKEVSNENMDIYRVALKSLYGRLDLVKDNTRDNNNTTDVNSTIYSMGLEDINIYRLAKIDE